MWLSEVKRKSENEYTEASCRIVTGQSRDILRPANILRLPESDEKQLVMSCPDGTEVQLGVIDNTVPTGLSAGEIFIETANAKITIKNNGVVNIEGSVNIQGSLTVNGVSI